MFGNWFKLPRYGIIYFLQVLHLTLCSIVLRLLFSGRVGEREAKQVQSKPASGEPQGWPRVGAETEKVGINNQRVGIFITGQSATTIPPRSRPPSYQAVYVAGNFLPERNIQAAVSAERFAQRSRKTPDNSLSNRFHLI